MQSSNLRGRAWLWHSGFIRWLYVRIFGLRDFCGERVEDLKKHATEFNQALSIFFGGQYDLMIFLVPLIFNVSNPTLRILGYMPLRRKEVYILYEFLIFRCTLCDCNVH